MFQKDYVLKMVEMIGQMIRGIIGQIEKGEFDTSQQEIDKVLTELFKVDPSFFTNKNHDEIAALLIEGFDFNDAQLEVLSDILLAQAFLHKTQTNKTESLLYYQHALAILNHVGDNSESYSLYIEKKRKEVSDIIGKGL